MLKAIEIKTIVEKSFLASFSFLSPIFLEIIALPPVESIVDIAITVMIIGKTIFIADKASVPTNLETNILSTIVYKFINTIPIIDGRENKNNDFAVIFLSNALSV